MFKEKLVVPKDDGFGPFLGPIYPQNIAKNQNFSKVKNRSINKDQEVRDQVSTTFLKPPNFWLTVGKIFLLYLKTCVIPVLVSLFYFHTPFFDFEPIFRGDAQPIEKTLLDF